MRKLIALILALAMMLIVMSACSAGGEDTGHTDPRQTNVTTPTLDSFAQAQDDKFNGNYDKALEGFLAAIENNPELYLGYLELADLYIRKAEFQNAYDILLTGKENVDETYLPVLDDKLLEFNYANVVVDSDNVPHGRVHISDGQLIWYHLYEYDRENKRLTAVSHCNGDGTVTTRIDLTFNERNQPLSSYAYYSDGSIEKIEFEYNSDGKLYKTTEYDAGGKFSGYSINEFDVNGYKIKESKYYPDEQLHWMLVYTHNVEEKSTEMEVFFYGKSVGTKSMGFSDFGYPNRSSSRFKGSHDREIEYDFDYFSNHLREEVIGEGTLVRIVCYNAPLSILY